MKKVHFVPMMMSVKANGEESEGRNICGVWNVECGMRYEFK